MIGKNGERICCEQNLVKTQSPDCKKKKKR